MRVFESSFWGSVTQSVTSSRRQCLCRVLSIPPDVVLQRRLDRFVTHFSKVINGSESIFTATTRAGIMSAIQDIARNAGGGSAESRPIDCWRMPCIGRCRLTALPDSTGRCGSLVCSSFLPAFDHFAQFIDHIPHTLPETDVGDFTGCRHAPQLSRADRRRTASDAVEPRDCRSSSCGHRLSELS